MLAACETGEVFALLEDTEHCAALYAAVREPILTRVILHYHARTGSVRALEILARAPDTHARHLLDALHDQLRGDRPQRVLGLSALAPLLARRPAWLHRLSQHPLARELLRVAPREAEPLPLLHALLALAALLPAAPVLAAPHWPELADAIMRPATLLPPPPPPARAHLQLAQLALFSALYASHPCSLLDALRAALEAAAPSAREAFARDLAPLLSALRLQPALVIGSRAREAEAARRATDDLASPPLAPPVLPPASPAPPIAPLPPVPGSGAHAARAAAALRPGAEPWFALAERCGADSAPNTPLPAEPAGEPPEAAVEATPENTPAKEPRAAFRYPGESGAVRALGRAEASPPAAESSANAARLARVALERRAAESPVPFGGAPPAGAVARPQARRAPLDVEDREVLELTERAAADAAWPPAEALRARDPRTLERGRPRARPGAPVRRAATCSPAARARGTRSVEVQTLDVWPAPYEFLIADFFRNLPAEDHKQLIEEAGEAVEATDQNAAGVSPCARLDRYLAALYAGSGAPPPGEVAEQLEFVHAQLMYERWRREAHAERNRRLLGRCRQTRALELQNAALRDRLSAAALERDELLRRLVRAPPAAPAAQPAERELRLEAALAAESAARLRAEAALREAEALRAVDAAELRRSRGESWEAARHMEALARAALAAERGAEHVRRLRRELLVLAEREARLGGAAVAAAGGSCGRAEEWRTAAEERALRAALARADAEAEAAGARAEAATARAHELETALAARETAVAELRRGARAAAEEAAARQRALRDKCAALARAVRAGEARSLERLAAAGGERS